MNKTRKLEFIKSKNEVHFIAELIVNMLADTNQSFIFLKGEIGSGKTTLVKEIAKVLKETETVISPTFNKMFIYEKLVHIDGYNFVNENLESLEDYFEDKIVVIEWADKIKNLSFSGFEIEILFVNENERKYVIKWKEF